MGVPGSKGMWVQPKHRSDGVCLDDNIESKRRLPMREFTVQRNPGNYQRVRKNSIIRLVSPASISLSAVLRLVRVSPIISLIVGNLRPEVTTKALFSLQKEIRPPSDLIVSRTTGGYTEYVCMLSLTCTRILDGAQANRQPGDCRSRTIVIFKTEYR